MKRIGLSLNIEPYAGGAYQYWITILESLVYESKSHGYEIVVFANQKKWGKIIEQYSIKLVDFDSIGNNLSYAINRIMERILSEKIYNKLCIIWFPKLRKIKKEKIELWISGSPRAIAKPIGAKSIVPIFDLMHLYEPQYEEASSDYDIRERYNKMVCRLSDIILADSEIGKNQLVESYSKDVDNLEKKVKVLPFIPADYIYRKECKKDFIAPFEKYIFYPAQFWKHKNHERLIKAIALLKREKGISVNLVCVGSAKNAYEDVQKMIKDEQLTEQIKILGYVSNEETVSLYCNASALIYPSFFGPTNIPPLEAFALGCPVAISNYYAMPEQVGDAALLFDPNSIEEIASCIELLWTNDDLCRDLINKGYARSKRWGKETFSHTLAQYIDELLED